MKDHLKLQVSNTFWICLTVVPCSKLLIGILRTGSFEQNSTFLIHLLKAIFHLRGLPLKNVGICIFIECIFTGTPLRPKAPEQSTLGKEIWQPIDPTNFGSDLSVRPSVRPYRLWGKGRGVPRQPERGRIMPSFLGGKSRGRQAFFLAGNRMTILAF